MKVSRSELHAALVKAGRGAGMDVELARQVSRALVWACTHDRLEALHEFLSMADTSLPADARTIAVALDHAIATPDNGSIALGTVQAPTLLEAMCVAWSENYNCSFTFMDRITGAPLCTVPDSEHSSVPTERMPTEGASLCCSELTVAVGTPGNDPDIDGALWNQITMLAARTYVPSSEASRASGAGAGLTDTD